MCPFFCLPWTLGNVVNTVNVVNIVEDRLACGTLPCMREFPSTRRKRQCTRLENYKKYVEGKSDEEILACGGDYANEDPYLRIAAQVRSSQTLIGEPRQAAANSSKMSQRVFLLTKVLAAAAVLQVVATAWPSLSW